MVFQEGDDFRTLRRPGADPAQFRSPVRFSRSVVPNSVVHQYRGENFTASTWTDSIGNADLTVSGPVSGTLGANNDPAVTSDGVDDFAKTQTGGTGPESLPANKTWGCAFVFRSTDTTDVTVWMGVESTQSNFTISDQDFFDSSNGEIQVRVNDGSSELIEQTQKNLCDGVTRAIVINKTSNTNIDIYSNRSGFSSPIQSSTEENQGFDHTQYAITEDMGFFSRQSGRADRFKAVTFSHMEFNESPYTESERNEFETRAGGV
jgi:hypothetical protein